MTEAALRRRFFCRLPELVPRTCTVNAHLMRPDSVSMRLNLLAFVSAFLVTFQTGCGREAAAHPVKRPGAIAGATSARSLGRNAGALDEEFAGTDSRGIPRYATRRFSDDERSILREAFGVVNPSHLYISDSTADGLLKYDPEVKRCSTCYVNSFRIGFVSVRNKGETWDELERRVRGMRRSAFSSSARVSTASLNALDPDVQPEVRGMLDAARRAGYHLRVVSTFRSPQQEALLMAEGGGRTHTLTSLHSYGRALDINVDDGNLGHASTRRDWIAFRGWVSHYRGTDFRVLGTPTSTWDWPHVELPSERVGFRNIDQAIAAGRACLSRGNREFCEFKPHLPAAY